jgi:hypothetical protein
MIARDFSISIFDLRHQMKDPPKGLFYFGTNLELIGVPLKTIYEN